MSTCELSRDPPFALSAPRAPRFGLSIARRAALVVAYVLVTGGSGAADEESIRAMLRDIAPLKDILVLDARGRMIHLTLQHIAASAERAEDLTRQMLAFSRKQPLRPRPTNVNDLVTDTGKLLRRALGEQVEIDSILADELWTVDVDRAQLKTALVNLCLNARDAMPGGGRVLVETRNIAVDAALAAHEPSREVGMTFM